MIYCPFNGEMTFLTEPDCEPLFPTGKAKPKRFSALPSTFYLLYGIIACLGFLILLLITAIVAPYFITKSSSPTVIETPADDLILFELEKMVVDLTEDTDSIFDEINELDGETSNNVAADAPDKALCYIVPNEQRFDCFSQGNGSQALCEARGCCWSAPSTKVGRGRAKSTSLPLDVPYCFYPFDYPSYHLADYKETANGFEGLLERSSNVAVYPSPIQLLRLNVYFETPERLHVKLSDASNARFEVPLPLLPEPPAKKPDDTLYSFKVSRKPFSFQITRKDTGTVIFDTSAGTLAFYDQFLEIASYLPSRYIYGLGEHTDAHFLHSVEWTKFTFWTTDVFPSQSTPLYGDHPFYLNMEVDGRANGVFLLNSNAMDVILQPTPAITYRTIGGVLDFYFFLGPSPKEVVAQYIGLVGQPALPPYWALGFHLCRWGYGSLAETKRIMERNIAAGVPLDTQWNDIDYMDHWKDFTLDKDNFTGVAAFVEDLHARGMHYVVITDPGISSVEPANSYLPYEHGVALNCFVKNATGQIIEGRVWTGGSQAYPDFTHPNASAYWTREIADFREFVPVDGLWIDMNEPSNFIDGSTYGCPKSPLETPPYLPQIAGATLATRTLCMTAQHYQGLHYNLHSMYGIYQALATRSAFTTLNPNKRPFILTRSSFIGQGQYSAHWTGDVTSDWTHLQSSVGDMLNFNMFGVPLVGADICGFAGDTTPELCLRWQQLGAFYPFMRNHNSEGQIPQDPAAFTADVVGGIKKALHVKYRLLPYYNSLFFRASLDGGTVVRALFFEYPHDPRAYAVDGQFMVGSGLMVSPVLTEGTTELLAYFPSARWFDFYTGLELRGEGEWIPLAAPLDHVNVHVRGGSVVPMQSVNGTTTQSRKNPFALLVAVDDGNSACGELFWDDGEQLDVLEVDGYTLVEFRLAGNILQSKVVLAGYGNVPHLGEVTVFGMHGPKAVLVNGRSADFEYEDMVVRIPGLDLDLLTSFVITFVQF